MKQAVIAGLTLGMGLQVGSCDGLGTVAAADWRISGLMGLVVIAGCQQ
ncbi:hypothetical protein J2Z21_008927 [Streptomyces griseochromogenes]|uniref:Uncharacterized protein n=1 Tax=Streptomyces griseochromogenes TaxID=68214 RepID=A0ABS4M8B6_9ACTN|nr:hypothetical protein [Streptomyces griseochromogenes]